MSALATFDFNGEAFRTEIVDGEPMFHGRDCCQILEIGAPERAFSRIPDAEKALRSTHTPGGMQEMVWLREAGFYRLIFESRKAKAEEFRTWVFSTVLPEIRRTGRFGGAGAKSELDSVLALARSCELVRRIHGRPAAQLMWAEMGGMPLPIDDDGVTKRYPTSAETSKAKGVGTADPLGSSKPVSPAKAASDARALKIVRDFLRECCVRLAGSEVQAMPLYQAYLAWQACGVGRPMSQTRFGRTMRHAGIAKSQRAVIYYHDLCLKPGVARIAS